MPLEVLMVQLPDRTEVRAVLVWEKLELRLPTGRNSFPSEAAMSTG